MQIEREVLIAASPKYVRSRFADCPYFSALRFRPEGINTRVTIRASLIPDDLGSFVENELLEAVCAVRDQLERAQNQQPGETKS